MKHFGIAKQIPVDVLDDFEKAVLNSKKEYIKIAACGLNNKSKSEFWEMNLGNLKNV